jgi:hypothetical protein
MPGFVRGLAGANRELNPDPDMLAMKKLPLYMQVAQLAGDRAAMLGRSAQLRQQAAVTWQNADSLALSREQAADATLQNAASRTDTEVGKYIDRGTTSARIFRDLRPDASPELIEEWVRQGTVEKGRAAARADAENEYKLQKTNESRATESLKRTQAILKNRFAPLEAMKVEAEIHAIYGGLAMDQFDREDRKAKLFMEFDRILRLDRDTKVKNLLALAAMPHLQGTAFQKKLEEEIQKAGGNIARLRQTPAFATGHAAPSAGPTSAPPGLADVARGGAPGAMRRTDVERRRPTAAEAQQTNQGKAAPAEVLDELLKPGVRGVRVDGGLWWFDPNTKRAMFTPGG